MEIEIFKDRTDAGYRLAERLKEYVNKNAVVLAIPRGGVPVGSEIARQLKAQFDVIIPRKIPIPWNPEAGFGAMTADGTMVLNESMVRSLDLREEEIEQAAEEVRQEIARRTEKYRGDRPAPDIEGKPVIIVDDGLASGYTMLAAIESVRKLKPSVVIIAVPVASGGAVRLVSPKADKTIAIIISQRLPFAVANYYRVWRDVTDDEVIEYLNEGVGRSR